MKTALIIGGSGLVGRELTRQLCADNRYGSVILLVRKKLNISLPNLIQHIIDFDDPDPSALTGDEMYCCLGTTIKTAGSKEQFRKVDHDYVLNLAQAACSRGIQRFAMVSAMGADPGSAIWYNKTKGDVEKAVAALPFAACHILRPSLLLGNRPEFRLGEKIAQVIMKGLSFLIPGNYKAIEASQVAKAMIHYMNQPATGVQIHLSGELLRI